MLGAGTMGHGIAQVAAASCESVTLFDVSPEQVTSGLGKIRVNLAKGVELGKVDPAVQATVLDALRGASSLDDAVSGADLIIEAVPEVVAIKSQLFKDIAEFVGDDTVLATNTSSLSVTELGRFTPDPGRFIGLHFFNPVHIMALVEVVRSRATSDSTLDRSLAFVLQIGKQPIVVEDSPGFASSRLGIALGLEAIRMVEAGVASASDIDKAMVLGYRHPMGPLRLTDLVGLDVRLGIAEYLHETLGSETFRPPTLLRQLVEEGKLGKKSGQGFYDWSDA